MPVLLPCDRARLVQTCRRLDVDIFVAQNPTQRLVDLGQEADVLTTDHFDEILVLMNILDLKIYENMLE